MASSDEADYEAGRSAELFRGDDRRLPRMRHLFESDDTHDLTNTGQYDANDQRSPNPPSTGVKAQ